MTVFRVIILILVFGTFSCASKKEVVKASSPNKVVIDSMIITKVPDHQVPPPPPTPPTSYNSEIFEMIEVIDEKGNTIAEVSSQDEAEKLVREKKNDSINNNLNFYQNVTKRLNENHELWDELLGKYVSETGAVNYKGFQKDSKDLSIYIEMLKMGYSKIDEYTHDKKLVYWINAYNALTIDLILRNYPIKSIKDIKGPWDQRLWQFGDKWLNLNDIEHKILRKMDEPRIHFAIVCASQSCPKLKNEAYTSTNLESQLTKATKDFLSDPNKNDIASNSLKLSKIFKWFAKDFKQNGNLIDFLNKYSEITISENAKKSYKDYNWELNE